MKKCPNENNIFTSKFTTSNTKKCEHCGVKVMALTIIIHCIQNSKNINNKDDKGGGCGGGNCSPQVRC
jgi:hypothetical protein